MKKIDSSLSEGKDDDIRLFTRAEILHKISKEALPFNDFQDVPLDALLSRIGKARVVLLGEATHGTSEFYQMRALITKELIQKKNFNIVAIEADWPDVELVNRYIRHLPHGSIEKKAFTRFPSWMWRNEEFHSFVLWLRNYNKSLGSHLKPVNLYGLDLYSLSRSIDVILNYLDQHDSDLSAIARQKYGCLFPWIDDPSQYGFAVMNGLTKDCKQEVGEMYIEMMKTCKVKEQLSEDFLSMIQNAKLIVDAEEYYKAIYESRISSWNLRDKHMFETLESLLITHGEDSKAVIWAHNSHIGNAASTEMHDIGEFNIGQLCKERFGDDAYLIGFGTHKGTVAAASHWGGVMEIKEIKTSHPQSYERLFHDTNMPLFLLPLREQYQKEVREALARQRLERAIGVIYLPQTEVINHYFQALLPNQFDEYIWFNHTTALTPLSLKSIAKEPETYPFGI